MAKHKKKENAFQRELKDRIYQMLPGCIILKNDEQYIQGIFDLTILYRDVYFALEVKREDCSTRQNNQSYYIDRVNDNGGYAWFISQDNWEEVLDAIYEIANKRR